MRLTIFMLYSFFRQKKKEKKQEASLLQIMSKFVDIFRINDVQKK